MNDNNMMDNKELKQREERQTAEVATKVFEAIMRTGDHESIDYDAAVNGVAITLAYVFKQYVEQAGSGESFDSPSHDFMYRLNVAYMEMQKNDENDAG